MSDPQKFADLGKPRRIWAVASIHGDARRLAVLHDDVGRRFQPGDRLVYLGNMMGRGSAVAATVDELLAFRRGILARRGVVAGDIVYLRGGQEEMWQKLLQLQFAPNPAEVLRWMLAQGLEPTLAAYGADVAYGLNCARDGAVALSRWTAQLRAAQRNQPGHDALFSALRRAAYTDGSRAGDGRPSLLFVNAGIDVHRPLGAQGDSFWWGGAAFARIETSYEGFARVVRGYDPGHGGVVVKPHTVTLDSGCGFGGPLAIACFAPDGEVLDLLEV